MGELFLEAVICKIQGLTFKEKNIQKLSQKRKKKIIIRQSRAGGPDCWQHG